ncbi:MAG: acyl-CoA desaturase [Deltaproteobacteria bacterium]|nr:acyl-CoA desaturase [Deltaproteobacteria bacterium]
MDAGAPGEAVARARSRGLWRVYFNALTIPYWAIHVAAVTGVIATGFSWYGVLLAIAFYLPRMFFVTGAYHRYFSHRSYKTSRWFQFVLALGATCTGQKGPLWWAAHHRIHHKLSDAPGDLHSVIQSGFWWAHHGWILSRDLEGTDLSRIKDFAKYPELRWLNTYWMVPPIAVGVLTALVGGWFAFVWAFCVAQVLCWHGTFTINSLSHLWGARRYRTEDDSRNNPVLAMITMGEGWHNNHHHYQVSARQGFYWWEVDLTFYILRAFSLVGLVWDLHGIPDHVRDDAKSMIKTATADDAEPEPEPEPTA